MVVQTEGRFVTKSEAEIQEKEAAAAEAAQYAAALDGSKKSYTREARSEYGVAISAYGRRLRALAEGKCNVEAVLVSHVNAAVTELGPDLRKNLKIFLDWLKRVGFLLAGLTIAQGVKVYNQSPIERGSVIWLIGLFAITLIMLVAAFIIDFFT